LVFLLKPIQSVLAFLTIIPVSKLGSSSSQYSSSSYNDIQYVASHMYLFPLAGAVVGIIVGGMAFGISQFLHPLIVGLLVAGAFVILTGVHHTDALADFADGLMAKGDKEKKRKAMMDPAVGSAGVAALVMYFAGMIIVFNTGGQLSSGSFKIFTSIIASEVIAKYVMVLLTYRGVSAWEGFSSPFTAEMKDNTKKMFAATAITLSIVWACTGLAGMAALAVSVLIGGIIRYSSMKSFGGISGDVLGASNEVARLASLIVFSSVAIKLLF
jgi:adenosylcobinamide-GDP ribazoletransferase